MSDLTDILKQRAKEYRTQLDRLDVEFASLRKEIEHVQNLLEHIDALLRVELGDAYQEKQIVFVPSEKWARLSVPKAIQQLLRESQTPMHADDIQVVMEKRGMKLSRKDPKATIVTALVRGVAQGVFARTAPNTFRHIENCNGYAPETETGE